MVYEGDVQPERQPENCDANLEQTRSFSQENLKSADCPRSNTNAKRRRKNTESSQEQKTSRTDKERHHELQVCDTGRLSQENSHPNRNPRANLNPRAGGSLTPQNNDQAKPGGIDRCNKTHDFNIRTIRGLKYLYSNVDIFSNKKTDIYSKVDELEPDIIALAEVKSKFDSSDPQREELEIAGYDCWPDIGGHGRGVVMWTKTSLNATSVSLDCSLDVHDSMLCEIRLHKKKKLLVGCIYRSPNSTSTHNDKICQLIKWATSRKYSHMVLAGDFNFREIDWKSEKCNASVNTSPPY